MKICLVRPALKSRFQVGPPLSLGYLASALKKAGYKDVSLIDCTIEELDPSRAAKAVKDRGGADVVGIQVYTGSHIWARDFIRLLKKELPDVVTIVGGPHVSALHKYAMDFIGADYGVKGEGEEPIVKFANFLENKITDPADVPGLLYKDKSSGEWKSAKQEFGFIEDANDIPWPDWELLNPPRYFKTLQSISLPIKGKKPTFVLTSRGCPFRCTFCSARLISKRIMRYREPENIVAEIKMLHEKYGVDEIFFSDDNLTMDLNRAEKIFDLLIDSGIKIHWRAPNGLRVDRLEEKLIKKMAKSGCYYVGLGIESGNQKVLMSIKKSLDVKLVPKQIKLLHKYGIKCSGFFMCGLISETQEQMYESINFAKSVPLDRIQVCIYTPYPGSDDFEEIMNLPAPKSYERNIKHFQKTETSPKFRKMDIKEMVKMQEAFLFSFYLRPKVIFSMLRGISVSQVRALLSHPTLSNFLRRQERDLYTH